MIDASRVAEAAEDSRAKNRTVLYASAVMKYNYEGGEEPRILVLTDSSAIYYMYAKSIVETTSCAWCNLTGMRFEGNIIHLSFGNEQLVFKAKDPFDISQKILVFLQRTKTYVEIDLIYPFSFNDYNYLPNAVGLLTRFKNICGKLYLEITNDIMNYITDLIIHNRSIFDLVNAPDYESYFIPLISTVQLAKCIRTIIIANSKNGEIFSKFSNFLQSTISTFSHIQFTGDLQPGFDQLCASMKNTDNCAVSSLTFTHSNPTDNDIRSLLELCKARTISSLSFKNFTNFSFLRMFYESTYKAIVNTITMINFDDSFGIDLHKILRSFSNLTSLSLARCNIDISDTLNTIAQYEMPKLGMVCLLGNYCKTEFKKLPSLFLLDISYVTFEEGTLLSFFYYIFSKNFQHSLNLRISNAFLSKASEWNSIFNLMSSQTSHSFNGLAWCGNPIDERLIDFIGKSPQVEELIFDNCDLSNVVDNLTVSLPKLKKLLTFSCSGKELNSAHKIIKALSHVNINELKMEDTKGGDELLSELVSLVKTSKELYLISFDGSEFKSYETFDSLLDTIEQRSIKFTLCWPKKDIKALNLGTQEESMFKARIWSFFNQMDDNKVDYLDLFDPALKPYQYSHYSVYFPMNNVIEEIECPEFDTYPQYYNQYVAYIEKKVTDFNKQKVEDQPKLHPLPITDEDRLKRDFVKSFVSDDSDFESIDFNQPKSFLKKSDDSSETEIMTQKEPEINIDRNIFEKKSISTFELDTKDKEEIQSPLPDSLELGRRQQDLIELAIPSPQSELKPMFLESTEEQNSKLQQFKLDVASDDVNSEHDKKSEILDLSYETLDSCQEKSEHISIASKDSLENIQRFNNLGSEPDSLDMSVNNTSFIYNNLIHPPTPKNTEEKAIGLTEVKQDKVLFSSVEVLLPHELNSVEFIDSPPPPLPQEKPKENHSPRRSSYDNCEKIARRVSNDEILISPVARRVSNDETLIIPVARRVSNDENSLHKEKKSSKQKSPEESIGEDHVRKSSKKESPNTSKRHRSHNEGSTSKCRRSADDESTKKHKKDEIDDTQSSLLVLPKYPEDSPRKRSSSMLEPASPRGIGKRRGKVERNSMHIDNKKLALIKDESDDDEISYKRPRFKFPIEWFEIKSSKEFVHKLDHKFRLPKLANILDKDEYE